jgi:hypothetical protein
MMMVLVVVVKKKRKEWEEEEKEKEKEEAEDDDVDDAAEYSPRCKLSLTLTCNYFIPFHVIKFWVPHAPNSTLS